MSPDAQPSKPRTLRRALLALAWLTLAATFTVIAILASFHLPAPTGPYHPPPVSSPALVPRRIVAQPASPLQTLARSHHPHPLSATPPHQLPP